MMAYLFMAYLLTSGCKSLGKQGIVFLEHSFITSVLSLEHGLAIATYTMNFVEIIFKVI